MLLTHFHRARVTGRLHHESGSLLADFQSLLGFENSPYKVGDIFLEIFSSTDRFCRFCHARPRFDKHEQKDLLHRS